ncbi:MAG: hypothetical protein AMS23_10305 [Bacteroides sp. SM1_62]|nr:MAG: hypothetical protein AMS26_06920 [Bacteroides sp. SM23_62]KPL20842.1 MAG: hypothetical protein AMS23_10305 [Bacteroides sp. SM1_62]
MYFSYIQIVKSSFTDCNIAMYAGLNTVENYMNRQYTVKSVSSSIPTEWHNTTKFGVNQVLTGGEKKVPVSQYRPHLITYHSQKDIPGWGISMQSKGRDANLVRFQMKKLCSDKSGYIDKPSIIQCY